MDNFADFNMVSTTYNEPISHITMETLISCERAYRDSLLEMYRAVYPGLKYEDSDILREGVDVVATVASKCIDTHSNIIESSYRKAMAQVNTKFSTYKKLAAKANIVRRDIGATYDVKIPKFTYIYGVPDLVVLHNTINDIQKDRDIFLSHDNDKINKLRNSVEDYTKNTTKKILDLDKYPNNPTKYFYDALRNDGECIRTTLDKDFVLSRAQLTAHFSNQIKDVTRLMNEYKAIMRRYFDAVMTYGHGLDGEEVLATLSTGADSDTGFFTYELAKFSKIMDAVTPLIMCKIEAISDELLFNIELLTQYTENDVPGRIVIREV